MGLGLEAHPDLTGGGAVTGAIDYFYCRLRIRFNSRSSLDSFNVLAN